MSGEFYWKIEKLKDWKIKSAARNERGLKWLMDSGVQTVGSGRAESIPGTWYLVSSVKTGDRSRGKNCKS
ncbi:hypothetical protein SAMN03080617_03166 [Algoriphagus alkaliphilus]|uniref:Uncharacterized protein n=1 Tax=Algoriphagus alkaliphilus TaxID=279824 RepID=A0A1G5Z4M2_9BACT|nr:hypothetical protein SAMN03080617_03166 [Algoriphagus alkaliphilus]